MNVWINTHWQEMDLLELSGGNPLIVFDRVKKILDRFGNPPEGIGKTPLQHNILY
jgi:hypothetical protein